MSTAEEAKVGATFVDLFRAAHSIQCEKDPDRKAALTVEVWKAFEEGVLPVFDVAHDGGVPVAVDVPARPDFVEEVPPHKAKQRSSRKALIHSLVHAESYAVDLAWDIIVRFGRPRPAATATSPSTSSSPSPSTGASDPASTTAKAHAGDEPATPTSAAARGAATGAECAEKVDEEGGGELELPFPRAFYYDFAKVAYDEALHYQRWRDRLHELDGSYGCLKAHPGLWDAATATKHSLAARLSLVNCIHEARGLDTAPIALRKFQRNVKDEVTHVAVGVKWLVYLCDGAERKAQALFQQQARDLFRGTLKGPFDEAGRTAAGLTPDWYMPLTEARTL